jgi:two-component system, OmpR family, response regulator
MVSWNRDFWEVMRPHSSGSQLLISSDTEKDTAQAMLEGKCKCDPTNASRFSSETELAGYCLVRQEHDTRNMPPEVGHVIVVDDDVSLREMLIRFLEDHHLPTKSASNRLELNRCVAEACPSLIILDVQLGRDDGIDVLKEIRRRSDVPIIIVTGTRPDEIDRIIALELGADDYLVKPFGLGELLARVKAVLRRQKPGSDVLTSGSERGGYRFNGWVLERRSRKLLGPNASPVSLTKGEYNLLLAFLNAAGRPLTREHLMQVTRRHHDIFDRSIDVQVLRLRRKLKVDPSAPHVIRAERGIGYVFIASVEAY